ncbi:MAG: phosphoadenylyl-sulfate reductase [Neisseriaceae bacterium]|nr:phosphoadenylyl-sulfate reductase [Neisseriaceae bacterium]
MVSQINPLPWQPPQATTAVLNALADKIRLLDIRLRYITEQALDSRLASSLAAEDMVLTDAIARQQLPITIFTLATGKLPLETLALLPQVQRRYGLTVTTVAPDPEATAAYEAKHGTFAFYDSVPLRQRCCHIRKIEPLNRALVGADAWLTGQRQAQSVTRATLSFHQLDDERQMAKFNPLFDWSEADVWAYIQHFDVPCNALYQQGYPSIGCDPCTKAVRADQDIRAGRWWWEQQDSKECGLHPSSQSNPSES